MAEQAASVLMLYGGEWHEVPLYSGDAENGQDITITRTGTADRGLTPAEATFTIDARAASYSPQDPTSPLWGLAGRNTRVRIVMPDGDRFFGEAAAFAPGQTEEFVPGSGRGDAWVRVTAAGVTRRITQGSDPLPSALRAFMGSQPGQVGYWPCEEAASSALPGGQPAAVTDVSFGADDDLPAAAGVMTFNSAESSFLGRVAPAAPSGFVSAVLLFKLDAVPSSAIELFRVGIGGTGAVMTVTMDSTQFGTNVYRGDGTPLLEDGALQIVDPTRWVALHYGLFQESPGTIAYAMYWHEVDRTTIWPNTGTFAGTLGAAQDVFIGPDAQKAQARFAHIDVTNAPFPFATIGLRQAVDAFAGWETAPERLERLFADVGVTFTSAGESPRLLGPQLPASRTELVEETQRTDDGLLFEPRDSLGVHYRTRRDLYHQAPALTLAFDDLVPPLEPVLDDLGARNDITVRSVTGAEARRERETGPMSVQDPPDGIGRVPTTIDVNPDSDDDLGSLADWLLAKGTADAPRFARVTVNVDRVPGAAAVDIGDLIVVTGLPLRIARDDVRLLVTGTSEVIETHRRRITFECLPEAVLAVGVLDDDNSATRYDTALSTTSGSIITGTSTSVSVASTGPMLWTTNPARFPLDIDLAGARVRVTAVSGASSPQTFTISSTVINGVAKTIPSGTPVRLWRPSKLGL